MHKRAFGVALAVGLFGATHVAADSVSECAEGQDFDRQILACSYLAEASGSERGRSMALFNRGLAYERHALIDEAKGSYDASLRMDPTFASAYIARGRIFEEEGEGDQALAYYDEAVRLEPGALALLHRGRVLEARGAYELSIADFRSALEADPDLLAAHNGLGRALARGGHLTQALAAFDRALVVSPGNAPSHYNRAIVLQALGDKPGATAALATALRLDPTLARSLPRELTALLPPRSPTSAGRPRSR